MKTTFAINRAGISIYLKNGVQGNGYGSEYEQNASEVKAAGIKLEDLRQAVLDFSYKRN